MNHYKYICLSIQDLSTGELVHSARELCDDEIFSLSTKPVQYFVSSDNVEELIQAKDIMESICNSIYTVQALHPTETELDQYNDVVYKTIKVSAYLDNIIVYNAMVDAKIRAQRNKKKTVVSMPIKKINKNRFQIVERYTSETPTHIESFSDFDDIPVNVTF